MEVYLLIVLTANDAIHIHTLETRPSEGELADLGYSVLGLPHTDNIVHVYWLPALPSPERRAFWKKAILEIVDPIHSDQYEEIR